MPGLLLHVGGITNCFHVSGVVVANPKKPPRVFVNGGVPVLSIDDLHSVGGCLYTLPGPKPQPCMTVKVEPAVRVRVNNVAAALLTPAAVCLSAEKAPQGMPVSTPTQKRVIAT
jgi:hypothetical protein